MAHRRAAPRRGGAPTGRKGVVVSLFRRPKPARGRGPVYPPARRCVERSGGWGPRSRGLVGVNNRDRFLLANLRANSFWDGAGPERSIATGRPRDWGGTRGGDPQRCHAKERTPRRGWAGRLVIRAPGTDCDQGGGAKKPAVARAPSQSLERSTRRRPAGPASRRQETFTAVAQGGFGREAFGTRRPGARFGGVCWFRHHRGWVCPRRPDAGPRSIGLTPSVKGLLGGQKPLRRAGGRPRGGTFRGGRRGGGGGVGGLAESFLEEGGRRWHSSPGGEAFGTGPGTHRLSYALGETPKTLAEGIGQQRKLVSADTSGLTSGPRVTPKTPGSGRYSGGCGAGKG